MIAFDFELRQGTGYLKLSGPLGDSDDAELRRILLNALNQSPTIQVDLKDVSSLSAAAGRIFQEILDQYAPPVTIRFSPTWESLVRPHVEGTGEQETRRDPHVES